jgi:hypothetical protein
MPKTPWLLSRLDCYHASILRICCPLTDSQTLRITTTRPKAVAEPAPNASTGHVCLLNGYVSSNTIGSDESRPGLLQRIGDNAQAGSDRWRKHLAATVVTRACRRIKPTGTNEVSGSEGL